MKTFALVALGLCFIICIIIFGSAMQATDYEASNRTGNNTEFTNQTITVYNINYAWYGMAAILAFIIAVGAVFWKFWG